VKVVVDTNIVFSTLLNSNSRIASILLDLNLKHTFYTTNQLLVEIEEHRDKLKKLTQFSDLELSDLISIVTNKIKFINLDLISNEAYQKVNYLIADIDPEDIEFVALAEYLNAKLWTGDKVLITGLTKKGWNKFISTGELYEILLDGE
jgi:predicted nucleic acid-binding protein